MHHPIDVQRLSPQIQKICGPGAPAPMKVMAAGGLAPLKPVDLVTVLYLLSHDADTSIAEKAEKSLSGMPPNVLLGVLDQLTDPELLDGIIRCLPGNIEAQQKVLLNRTAVAETVVWIVRNTTDDKTLEITASNEDRMLKNPAIIEALYHNKAARMSTVDRAVELAVRNGLELDGIPCFKEIKAALTGVEISAPTEVPTEEDSRFAGTLDDRVFHELDNEMVDAALDSEELQPEEHVEKVLTAQQSLTVMNASSKIRVATLGSPIQRAILIRDSNKLVVMAVVKSPALNDSEVMRFARFRTLPEEAVRYIASNREWTKHYSVKLNLVQNPRCPLEFTLRFLPHLRLNDLRSLGRDKNIPQAVARAAKQLMTKRSG